MTMALSRPNWVTNTIQSLANRTKGQATAVKQAFDKAASDIKTFVDAMCTEIEAQFATKAEIQGVVLGQIPDGTVTPAKLSFDPFTNIPTAGGTATALTIAQTGFTLANGAKAEFIASANNSGAATTANVNGTGAKPIYKPGGTNAPNLITGKAYTIWYNTSGGNFFLKASAEGDAVAANVLADKTFSNDSDSGITGTMPNNAGDSVALASSISGTTLKLRPPTGYFDGVDDNVTITGTDYVPGNIKQGVDLFGKVGTFPVIGGGSNMFYYDGARQISYGTPSLTKQVDIDIVFGGTYRVSFHVPGGGAGTYSTGRIYVNDVAVGPLNYNNTAGGVAYTDDITVNAGDNIQLYTAREGGSTSGGYLFRIDTNFQLFTVVM